jgi:hypothetical protein
MAGVGVRLGGTSVDVAGGGGVSSVDGWSVASATWVGVGVCSSVGGIGVSVGVLVGVAGVSSSVADDSTIATNSAGNCGIGMLSEGSCPLKKNAPAMMAAITPVTLVAMRARRARTVSSSRTMGKIVDRASRAERLAMVIETTIAARLNPAKMTSNHESNDMTYYSRISMASGASTMISGAPWYILTWPVTRSDWP